MYAPLRTLTLTLLFALLAVPLDAFAQDGTVTAWGYNGSGETDVPAGLSDVVQVATGGYHSLAVKSDGTVVAWGANWAGQMDMPAGLSDVVQVAAGVYHSLAIKSDGTVVAWGDNGDGQTDVPAGLSDVVQVAAGDGHSLALKSDGTVVAWGYNGDGQTDVPAGLSDVVQVTAGYRHNLAVRSDGTVAAWGWNGYGQTDVPAGLSDVAQAGAGWYHSAVLKSDGTVIAWGDNRLNQTDVPVGLSGVGEIATTGGHTLARFGPIAPANPIAASGQPTDGSGNPVGQPIAMPAAGGTAPFEATLTNNTAAPIDTQVWLGVRFPDGTLIVKRRAQTVTLQPGTPLGFQGGFDLFPAFPDGTYTFYGYYGTHPDGGTEIFAITIEKAPARSGAPAMTTAEILALDPDAFLVLDAPRATAATPPALERPTTTVLGSAYPNPFNPSATVPFTLAEAATVRLAVYDVLGREVAVLVDGRVEAGSYTVTLDGSLLPSGSYLLRLTTPTQAFTQRVTLLK